MMSYASADQIAPDEVPVIDIGPLRDGSAPEAVAQELCRASHEVGFLYVANHGLPEDLIARARREAMAFFTGPAEAKLAVKLVAGHRGFIPVGEAFMTKDSKMDLKESFVWGLELPDQARAAHDPNLVPPANIWPSDRPAFKSACRDYFEAAQDCAKILLGGFALGLGLAPDFFCRSCDRQISRASFTYYPPQPPGLGGQQFGVAPHTDYGCLTVLCQDDVGGLQVQRKSDGAWVAAPPIEGTLVVNVGDLLARWTGGYFTSTPHRVINASRRERLSLVFAFDPDYETPIDSAQVFPDQADGAPEPILCGDYITARLGRSFRYKQ